MTNDLTTLTASQALPRLTSGDITAEALARACIERAHARDPEVRAWSFLDPLAVIAQARALDAAGPRGPLHGLPIGIKDVILTRDMPTQYNSEIYTGFHPRMDAACVQTLRAAGALVFGKTDTVEFAATGRRALTRNPHNLAHTPGASSSGSAAAVADGHVPLALGTQTGGSMIRPASFCGVYAMKPTWGLVSTEGARRYSVTLDTIGWFARSVADLGLLYDVFDIDPEPAPPLDIAGADIAVCRTPMWDEAQPATRAAMETAIGRLAAAGARIAEIVLPAPFEALARLHVLLMRSEGGSAFLSEYRANHGRLGQSFRDQVENVDGYTRQQLIEAYDTAAACRTTFDRIAAGFDAVLAPSAVGEAPLGLQDAGSFVFNGLWTLLHTPCINLPGFTGPAGLPVGLTLTGPRFSDRKLLAAAHAVAAVFEDIGRRAPTR